jgi:hypothetical protein
MARTIQDWMREGEELYESTVRDCQNLESQMQDLEQRLADKHSEMNRLAQILGKPLADSPRRVTAQIIDDQGAATNISTPSAIARALSGRSLAR